jgi:GT2 family glycosyltransferase
MARGQYRLGPEGSVTGWVALNDGASKHAPLAIVCGDTVVSLVEANEPSPSRAPFPSQGFRWDIPDLVRAKAAPLKIIDLISGEALEGPALLPAYNDLPLPSPAGWGAEPAYWVRGIAGHLNKWFNHIAEGIWATVDPQATGARFARVDPPPSEKAFSWALRLTAESEVGWVVHQRLPLAAADIEENQRFRLWLRLSQATSNVTQCHCEIFLSRWNGECFETLRRLRRSRVMRKFTSTEVQIMLEPEEKLLAAAGELELTVSTQPCFGIFVCPIVPAPLVDVGERFEDGRLVSAFDACEQLSRIMDEELGREILMAPKAEPRLAPSVGWDTPMTEIIVPIYNGADVVMRCLRSIQSATDTPFRVQIVDDGSRDYTTLMLDQIVAEDDRFTMHRRAINRGYTKSINEAVKLTTADWVVILNSDTVVSQGWLRRLHEAAECVPGAGLVGPLSNAATWQSIPQAKNADGSWSQNDFIEPQFIEQVQEKLAAVSECQYPEFPVLNGFCTLISRSVFDVCGYFDEEAFPLGYGEETDLCLRAGLAGFKLVVADNCFVYHEKSVSFGSAKRSKLTRAGGFELKNKHTGVNIGALERLMQTSPAMVRLRSKLNKLESELRV